MTPDETPVQLLDFQIHFARTHIKERFDDLMSDAKRSGKPLAEWFNDWLAYNFCKQTAYRDDKWFARDIRLDACYIAHTDFRTFEVPKDGRFVDFLPAVRKAIERGEFPCSSQIRAPWSGAMPEPMTQERGSGRFYVLDGQCRVIRHWYHKIATLRAFVYRGEKDV
jgi:hypothetical protein